MNLVCLKGVMVIIGAIKGINVIRGKEGQSMVKTEKVSNPCELLFEAFRADIKTGSFGSELQNGVCLFVSLFLQKSKFERKKE